MKQVCIRELGQIDYKDAWDLQERLFAEIVQQKIANRKLEDAGRADEQTLPLNQLLICEHPHVYTLGKSGDAAHLLLNRDALEKKGASFYPINRGGDITYHGPGQLVVYPLFDLDQFFTDIHRYLRTLEEAVIRTMAEFSIQSERLEKLTGVWLDADNPALSRKICAMGVRCSRWVTMHGLALNVNTDLDFFSHIVPCGIADRGVTSMEKELGRAVDFDTVKDQLTKHLQTLFAFEPVTFR